MSDALRIDAASRRVLTRDGRDVALLRHVGELQILAGPSCAIEYETLAEIGDGEWTASAQCALGPWQVHVNDRWLATDGGLRLVRQVAVPPLGRAVGLHVRTEVHLATDPATTARPFVPANLYETAQLPESGVLSFSDGRVSYPVAAVHLDTQRRLVALLRTELARVDDGYARDERETEYLHATDIGSVGIAITAGGADGAHQRIALIADYPYAEGDGTAYLDASGTPARAYTPVPPAGATFVLHYLLADLPAPDYPHGVRAACELACATQPPRTPELPFTLVDAVELRRESMAKAYVEWANGGAGFVLNFDPDLGYASAPLAFGASFTEHHMERARDILEYGFTGRQLNVAYMLAESGDARWQARRRRVCDFFARTMVTDSGFCHSHYDLALQRPLFAVGDASGSVLHYLATADASGTYLRLITEAASDLLLNCKSAAAAGEDVEEWADAVSRVAEFLVRAQRPDGSWARAYTPDGAAITGGEWLGAGDAATSATAVPIPFLLAVAEEYPSLAAPLVDAAERAAEFVRERQVRLATFRGGTLDNPNVIDKESAFIAMAAMVALHKRTGRSEYLEAAATAAWIGASWTLLWDIPAVPGTRVHRAHVRSTGWGGINSIWGAGVTDIYSLFYLADLLYVAAHAGEPLLATIAELTAYGTAQMLASSHDLFEMADAGMQPEGIAHCGQGIDEGLINKGDSWGGLGWMYTAGTYGLTAYLQHVKRTTEHTAETVLA